MNHPPHRDWRRASDPSRATSCPRSCCALSGTLFPLGTFVVNLVGCVVFGAIVGAAQQRFALTPEARAFLLIGVLGGFTTFSSYAFESVALLRDGQFLAATINIVGQVVAGPRRDSG